MPRSAVVNRGDGPCDLRNGRCPRADAEASSAGQPDGASIHRPVGTLTPCRGGVGGSNPSEPPTVRPTLVRSSTNRSDSLRLRRSTGRAPMGHPPWRVHHGPSQWASDQSAALGRDLATQTTGHETTEVHPGPSISWHALPVIQERRPGFRRAARSLVGSARRRAGRCR